MRISTAQVWVFDQDEALAFYTQKLGMEVRQDLTERRRGGDFRWLTVAPAGQEDVGLVLMAIPTTPPDPPDTVTQLRGLVAKGLVGTIFLRTDDCRSTYRELRGRGVEFYETPQARPYGIDAGFRDPFGNTFRLVQLQLG